MSTAIKVRTARQPHVCSTCRHTIAAGHRYLIHTEFPGRDQTQAVITSKECVACACERDDSIPLLLADACSTCCCGITPCALPFQKGAPSHDHSCRQCAQERVLACPA